MTGALCRMNVSDPQGVLTYKMGRDFPTFTKQGPGTHDLVKITRKSEESRWVCRRWHNTRRVNDMLDGLDWPSLEDLRLKSSPTFFYKIHSGTVSLTKINISDGILTPAPRLRNTRASHDSQYTRYMSYSDALKNSFFPRTIPLWNSLSSSVVASKTTEEFKALI